MAIKLNSTGGGSVTLDSPSTASNYTVTLPSGAATLAAASGQTFTNATITYANSNTVEATSGPSGTPFAFRNRIINGDMRIDQRNAGASVTVNATGYTLDRWLAITAQSGKYSVQQNAGSVSPPSGFANYIGVTSLSAYSSVAGDAFLLNHYVEGLNSYDFGWGTSGAVSATLSFWVRSSLTGTFSLSVCNQPANSNYITNYTINSANTWEYKTITIPAQTAGSWNTNNTLGIQIRFDLGSGSNYNGTAGSWITSNLLRTSGSQSVVGTNGATFYITGVQLEKGTAATPFEVRPYGVELQLCQRYFEKSFVQTQAPANGTTTTSFMTPPPIFAIAPWGGSVSYTQGDKPFAVVKRATPTVTIYGNSNGNGTRLSSGAFADSVSYPGAEATALTPCASATGIGLANNASGAVLVGVYAHWTASAEL